MKSFLESITFKIILANSIIFFLESIPGVIEILALTPISAVNGMFWQFFTYMYAHVSIAHLFVNMFGLFMFGPVIEHHMGSKKFFIFYTICGIGSAILHILLSGIGIVPLLGASGAVFGVLAAYGILYPKNIIYVNFIPMPAIVVIGFFVFIELLFGITGIDSDIAHFGHLGGIIAGFLLIKFLGFGKRKGKIKYFWE